MNDLKTHFLTQLIYMEQTVKRIEDNLWAKVQSKLMELTQQSN